MEITRKLPEFLGDFESGWGDWSADNGVWEVGQPTAGPDTCHSGSQCAGTNRDGLFPPDTDSRLISPSVHLPQVSGNKEVHLRFWQWFDYDGDGYGRVQISTYDEDQQKWSGWTAVSDRVEETSADWTVMDVDLTAYAGEKVRTGFYHAAYPGTVENVGWYIDDVEVVKKVPEFDGDFESGWGDWSADNGVWEVGEPTAGPDAYQSSSQCAVTNLDGFFPAGTDSRLISSSVRLPQVDEDEEVHLGFWQWFDYEDEGYGHVEISTYDEDHQEWSGWTQVSDRVEGTSEDWAAVGIDLTAYTGEKVKIGFYHAAYPWAEGSLGWYVDDVEILAPFPLIDKLKPRYCEPREVIRILGENFGEVQGESVVHLGTKTFDSNSRKMKLWSDTKIKIKVRKYKCDWFKGKEFRRVKVWVTVDRIDSNKKRLKVLKPASCD